MQSLRVRYSSFFSVEQDPPAGVVRFDVRTVLDSAVVEDVAGDLYDLVDQHNLAYLVLDMAGVRFLSSQALGVLVNLQRKAQAAGGQMVLAGISENLARMFRITRLDTLVPCYSDTLQAVQALQVVTQHRCAGVREAALGSSN